MHDNHGPCYSAFSSYRACFFIAFIMNNLANTWQAQTTLVGKALMHSI